MALICKINNRKNIREPLEHYKITMQTSYCKINENTREIQYIGR